MCFVCDLRNNPIEYKDIRTRLFLSEYSTHSLSLVQLYIIDSCIKRGDTLSALQLLHDWKYLKERVITKYKPGTHYYALDKKFNTLPEAEQYLISKGFSSAGVRYQYVYTNAE